MWSYCPFVLLFLVVPARTAFLDGERDLSEYTYEQFDKEFPDRVHSRGGDQARKVFQQHLELMREHNADPDKTWFAAPNEFMDMSNDEFRLLRTSRGSSPHNMEEDAGEVSQLPESNGMMEAGLPDSVDWRSKGMVTPVKNQGGCGSCWAFSAVETLESFLAIATQSQPVPVLSEQQVVSCMPNPQHCGGTGGCGGATQELAFNYTAHAGLSLESSYPYTGAGKCDSGETKPYATNDGYVKLKVNDYNELISAVANKGPIAISLAAGSLGWQLYGGGVFSGGMMGKCGYDQDHGVQLVGYGSDSGKMYWLVRNSWGATWGEKGYIRIRRFGQGAEPCGVDKTPQDGEACEGDTKPRTYCGFCGILGSSSYPTGARKVSADLVV